MENNIKVDAKEIGCEVFDLDSWDKRWAIVSTVLGVRVPENEGNVCTGREPFGFPVRDQLHG